MKIETPAHTRSLSLSRIFIFINKNTPIHTNLPSEANRRDIHGTRKQLAQCRADGSDEGDLRICVCVFQKKKKRNKVKREKTVDRRKQSAASILCS